MIFGFNTDIKVDETVYHVQSEEREAEKLLQTQVFVKGHCIGKRALNFSADEASTHNEQTRHELLREQHRSIVQAIREGHLDTVIEAASTKLAAHAPVAAVAPAPLAPVPQNSLAIELKFLGVTRPTENSFLVRFGVAQVNAPLVGATMLAKIVPDSNPSETFSAGAEAQGQTDQNGLIELTLPIPMTPHGEANLVVQVSHGGISIAKKFKIKTQA